MASSSPLSLQGKIAIVTGASRGIGAGLALELAIRGAKVVITYTQGSSEKLVDELMSKIKALDNDSTAIKVQAELRDPNGPEKIVAATRKAYGDHIDILINNAGISIVKSFLECTPEDYDYVVNLNLRSLFFMTKAVVPHLRSPGRIVNVSSIGARAPFSGLCMYIASKAGVEGLTRALAAELGPLGHTINSVNPGPVQTEMLDLLPKDFINDMVSHTPMERRLGTIDDIAQIVGFLAEERSRWITGQTISASGGYSMY